MPSTEIVVGEKVKVWPPASILVVGGMSEHENGPLITAVVPLGRVAVPEALVVTATNANKQMVAPDRSRKIIATVTRIERRWVVRSICEPSVAEWFAYASIKEY